MLVHAYFPRDSRVRRAAEALIEAGHEVEVVCLRAHGETATEVWNGVSIRRFPIRRMRGGTTSRYLREYGAFAVLATAEMTRRAFGHRYDVIHANNMPDVLVFAGILPRALGAKVVLDMHDPMPELLGTEHGMSKRKWVVRVLDLEERISCRFADFIITVSDSMKERLVARGVSADQVGVVMNLPDKNLVRRLSAARARREDDRSSGLPSRFLLVYAGTVSERYGLDVAIRAMDRLRSEMSDLRLAIAGEGPHLPALRRQVEQLGLEDRVAFLGHLSHEDIPGLLADGDAAISCHRDGAFWRLYFSSKIMEALAAGLPVISSRTYTIERYLDDSVLFFFRPGDVDGFVEQVRTIRTRPDLVRAKREAAAIRLAELNWDREKTKLLEILSRVANS